MKGQTAETLAPLVRLQRGLLGADAPGQGPAVTTGFGS